MNTREPIPTRFLIISSKLLSVAWLIVAPASSTGSRCARGVSLPVRPTSHVTSFNMVVVSSAANLNAIAQRGNLSVLPKARRVAPSTIFTTIPSIRKSRLSLRVSARFMPAYTSLISSYSSIKPLVGRLFSLRKLIVSSCPISSRPSI